MKHNSIDWKHLKNYLTWSRWISLVLSYFSILFIYLMVVASVFFQYWFMLMIFLSPVLWLINRTLKNHTYTLIIKHFLRELPSTNLPYIIEDFFSKHQFDFKFLKKQYFSDLIITHPAFQNSENPSKFESFFYRDYDSDPIFWFFFWSFLVLNNLPLPRFLTYMEASLLVLILPILYKLISYFFFPCPSFFSDMKYTIDYISKMQSHPGCPMGFSLPLDGKKI
jgi:hypothetical protein